MAAEVTSHQPQHHRKIDLQSPLDLQYLRQNLERAAQQKLDLHFPLSASHGSSTHPQTSAPAAVPEDPMRASVSALVNDFISHTFRSAAHSISINGLDATSLGSLHSNSNSNNDRDVDEQNVEYEPYDPRLTTQLSSLYAELESLTTQVAKLRRGAPGKAARAFGQRFDDVVAEEDKSAADSVSEAVGREDGQAGSGRAVEIVAPREEGWQRDVEDMYERGLGELMDLVGKRSGNEGDGEMMTKKSLTGTVGLVERAGGVVREME